MLLLKTAVSNPQRNKWSIKSGLQIDAEFTELLDIWCDSQ